MNKLEFVHLHVHSDYSIIDGLSKPEELIKAAINFEMPSLAITDFNNLYGVVKFYNTSHKLGLKPIIGTTVKFFSELINNELTELTILAATQKGYKNLILLISRAYQKGCIYNKQVTIKKKWLSEFNSGLILLSGGCRGEIGKILLRNNLSLLSQGLYFYKKYYPESYYLELIRTGRENEEKYLHLAIDLSFSEKIPVVATNDVCFLNKEDFKIHKIRISINEGETLKNSKIQQNYSEHQFLKNSQEMHDLFCDIPEALINSVEISKRCNVFIKSGKYFLPTFPTGKKRVEDYLINKAKQGLKQRLKENYKNIKEKNFQKYKNRLNFELNIINKMGFPSYFLIVMEFIAWAKNNNIPVGPGRGSGAGSLVAYALKITEVDPLFFDLLFERFLNPERISLPDFDIDFCMEKRDQVIEHVKNTYGIEAVAQIITFGTMTAKAVIRDVGRVLGYPYGFLNRLSKLVPLDPGITLDQAFLKESELYNLYKQDEDVRNLIDISKKLEGVNRNVGKHAGGVVIAPTKIIDFCPLYYDEKGHYPVTQFDKNDVEYVGLLKFDFLGLRTLTTINCAMDMINKNIALLNKKKIDINSISLNDKKCFSLLQKCETISIFQLESYGMQDLIKRLQPDCFEDIIALLALFRPGPLQSGMVDNFINRKHGYEEISYPDRTWQHISLKPILESTYGIILYQEQVMQIAQVLAGFSLGKADLLRRAISKKNLKDMSEQRIIFINGAKKNKINLNLAEKIFDLLEKFAGYGFNKSHSVAYALISYHTLWLKTYYPSEFMASTMTSEIDNTEKIVILVREVFRMKIKILPPNINLSKYEFCVDNKKNIIYGLGAIKGIGENSVRDIVSEREKNGCFSDLFDLCMRVDSNKITRRILEKLIMSGSFDCIDSNRGYLLSLIDDAIKASKEHNRIQMLQQQSLFGEFKDELKVLNKNNTLSNNISFLDKNRLNDEYQVLGFYLTGHPINNYLSELNYYKKYFSSLQIKYFKENAKKIFFGIVVSLKIKKTKKNDRVAIIILDNPFNRLEVIIFEKQLNIFESVIKINKILIIKGALKTDFSNKHNRLIAHDIISLSLARKKYLKKLSIILRKQEINKFFIKKLIQFFTNQHKGETLVQVFLDTNDVSIYSKFTEKYYIKVNNNFFFNFRDFISLEEIKFQINFN
ncbi:DNA polymerase III subunit alpha [Buchnera aphidicola (Melanaphis sacchari)]|uniref:DNA polymerase III subunit alpha n=1 Tax=Buchnera aphidicola (Melanaphis sacchari) TaxID=2173854 RepID=A0A2U8DFF1_9GAMM|nr:DNA polymerase III subunit alpha [Buchnera aphidicola]AWH90540.1 DNA polymerase III subunit alpha [Buchnera aphidicola (Melanaphis sacchari)]